MNLFSQTLKDLRQGQADIDVAKALEELIGSVRATGRPGRLTLTVTVAPLNKGDGNQVTVSDAVKLTKPSVQTGVTVLFTTEDNSLQKRDPKQPELTGLREVAQFPAAEAREVKS